LPYNVRLIFNEEEKKQLDAALEEHDLILHVWGICKSAGLRG
jgi:hypothetical protein